MSDRRLRRPGPPTAAPPPAGWATDFSVDAVLASSRPGRARGLPEAKKDATDEKTNADAEDPVGAAKAALFAAVPVGGDTLLGVLRDIGAQLVGGNDIELKDNADQPLYEKLQTVYELAALATAAADALEEGSGASPKQELLRSVALQSAKLMVAVFPKVAKDKKVKGKMHSASKAQFDAIKLLVVERCQRG